MAARLLDAAIEVVFQRLAVDGMGAVLDNGPSLFNGGLAAQVGHTLFGDVDVDVVTADVLMGGFGHDGRDVAALDGGGCQHD